MKEAKDLSYFYVMKIGKRWLQWGFIALLAFITAFVLWMEQFGVASTFKENQPSALIKGNPDHEQIALTFNISWGEEKVYPILEHLEKHDVQATFFVNGEWAEKNPNILQDISEQHHEIGMLGYRYKSYVDQEIDQVRQDIHQAKAVFAKLDHEDIKLMRVPNGQLNEKVVELAKQLGLEVIHWNVNPNDWENPGTNIIIDHVLDNASNGDIILLHASDAVKQTAKALESILPELQKKGFSFVTISELIHDTETEIEPIE